VSGPRLRNAGNTKPAWVKELQWCTEGGYFHIKTWLHQGNWQHKIIIGIQQNVSLHKTGTGTAFCKNPPE
jgi:hypothetical protein